jgi:hypothetical protein
MNRLAVMTICLPLSGCGLYALGGVFGGGTPLTTSASEPPYRAFNLSGTLQVPENLTAQGALEDAPAMSISKPFETVAGLAELDSRVNYRVLGVQFKVGDMSWTPEGLVRRAYIEVIDPESGEVVSTGRTDDKGRFNIRAFTHESNQAAFILQAVLKNAMGQTAGILAAPVGNQVVSVDAKRKGVDVTAGSTLLAFTSMLMSENFNDITLDKGFAGIKSVRLSRLVRQIDNDQANQAASVLNRGNQVISAPNFDVLLGNLATSSAVLTYEVKKVSQQAAGGTIGSNEAEVSFHAAAMNSTIANLVRVTQQNPASASVNLFKAAAELADIEALKKQAEKIQREIPPDSVPPLPPAPTPTPGSIGVVFE